MRPSCEIRGGLRRRNALKDHMAKRVLVAEPLHRIQNLNPGQPSVAVIICSDTFGQMLGGHGRLAEGNAQSVHFGVVADFHGNMSTFKSCSFPRRTRGGLWVQE